MLDYTHPAKSVRWNWIAELDSERAIDNAVQSIIGKEPPQKSDPYFFHMDSQILRGLLELASVSSHRDTLTASALLRTLKDQGKLVAAVEALPQQPGLPTVAGPGDAVPRRVREADIRGSDQARRPGQANGRGRDQPVGHEGS